MKTWIVLGYLVSSLLQFIYHADGTQSPYMMCRYSDGALITVPGYACPPSD